MNGTALGHEFRRRNYDSLGPGPRFKVQFEDVMTVNSAQIPPPQDGGSGAHSALTLPVSVI